LIRALKLSLAMALLCMAGCTREVNRTSRLGSYPMEIGSAGTPLALRHQGSLRDWQYSGDVLYYRVSKTDTVAGIAVKFYGNRDRSLEVYAANKEVLKDAGGLKRGMILALPVLEQ